MAGAARIVGVHYLNPPHLMPPVEVIPGEATAPETVERIRATLIELGKSPLLVRREVPGFLWNRLQFALAREAFWLVENGVATMEEVDLAMRRGLGRRWAIAGPFASLDLGGIDTMASVAAYLFPELSDADKTPGFLDERIAGGPVRREERGGLLSLARRQTRHHPRPTRHDAAGRAARGPRRRRSGDTRANSLTRIGRLITTT